jgi:hypothetical protein
VAEAWLERAASECDDEVRRRGPVPAPGPAAARIADPAARRADYERASAAFDRLASLRAEARDARRSAAERAGARSVADYLAPCHPIPPAEVVEAFRRGAVEPLDESVLRASRDRRLRVRTALLEPAHPADEPVLAWLGDHDELPAANEIPPFLRRLGVPLGADPDLPGGPSLARTTEPVAPFRGMTGEGTSPAVVLGRAGGPAVLGAALGAFGEAARAAFLREVGGDSLWRWADPAFAVASRTLFRRLVLSDAFRAAEGVAGPPALEQDLRYEEAVAPRRAWTYLLLATRSIEDPSRWPDPAAVREALERAAGRPPTPWQVEAAEDGDPRDAAELRGLVLGLLIEERLLSRHGRAWYRSVAARRELREFWEAESGQTAEGVAVALDLGTIEPTPILDRCRP